MAGIYEPLFRHALYPFYESVLRRRHTLRYLREYEASQWLSAEQVRALQWKQLKALLEFCYREVPYYAEQWRRLGVEPDDIRTPQDFARLPLLTKDDIRTHFEQLKARPYRDTLLLKLTGGSTGDPLRFGHTRESYERRNAVMWRGYSWGGAKLGRRALYLWAGRVGGPPSRARRAKEWLYHSMFARRLLNTFSMSEANMASFADAIDRYRPEIIVGYVGPAAQLARWMLETGRKVHRPKAFLGAAEALHGYQRAQIEQAFGCPAYNTYGCREFMLIASECERRDGLHINADHLMVEINDPRPCADGSGSAGDVVITDLNNYGMPFIRYTNGDLAESVEGDCACGRGLPRLAHVRGRKLDALRTPRGQLLPGEFFPHMLKDVPGLRQFQVVQRQLDRLDITLVRGPGFSDAGLDYIRAEVAKVLGDSVSLRFDYADRIAKLPNGKFRVTRCELA